MSISIITPIYNRAQLIKRLYDSLLQQDSYDFEWIVVDDGSTDDIDVVISSFVDISPFNITFLQKSNGGKHTAVNLGVKNSKYDWVFIVDSDDFLPQMAVSIIARNLLKINDDNCCGIICLKALASNGDIIGDNLNTTSNVNNEKLAGISGDKALVFRTGVLKEHLFPVFSEEKFITEAVVWNKILDEYYLKPVSEIVYYVEYLSGGLSDQYKNLLKRNPFGTLYLVSCNLSLKKSGLNIYKQSIFHFVPIAELKTFYKLFGKTPFKRFLTFLALYCIHSIKRNITSRSGR